MQGPKFLDKFLSQNQPWPTLAIPGHPWPTLANPGQPWPTLAIPGQPWPCVLDAPPFPRHGPFQRTLARCTAFLQGQGWVGWGEPGEGGPPPPLGEEGGSLPLPWGGGEGSSFSLWDGGRGAPPPPTLSPNFQLFYMCSNSLRLTSNFVYRHILTSGVG